MEGMDPLSDQSNLLGPSTVGISSTCHMNYGTNTNVNSPMPPRRYIEVPAARDSFRRHSAHGRICSAASEHCSEGARNVQGGARGSTASAHHHLHQQVPVCQNIGP